MSVSEGKKKNEDGLEVVPEGRVGDEGKEASGLGNSLFFCSRVLGFCRNR